MNFFGSVVHGIEMMASSISYSILLYQTEETTALEKKAVGLFRTLNGMHKLIDCKPIT